MPDWFGTNKEKHQAEELDSSHAVIISFDLTGEFGTHEERDLAYALEDQLEDALEPSGVGDLDGHEFGNEECIIYMYGPNAAKIFDVVEPVLRKTNFKPMRVTQRFGEADDEEAETKKQVLN